MFAGIIAGATWAIATVVLGIALGMSPFCSTEQAIFLAPFVSTFLHDACSAIWSMVYNGARGQPRHGLGRAEAKGRQVGRGCGRHRRPISRKSSPAKRTDDLGSNGQYRISKAQKPPNRILLRPGVVFLIYFIQGRFSMRISSLLAAERVSIWDI